MRVLTWNLWWRFGDWRARRPAILAVLRAERPDVVCLQEVWDSPVEGSSAEIAEHLGLHVVHGASPAPGSFQRRTGETHVGVGNAVLSRWPISRSLVHPLPDGDGLGRGRVAVLAVVEHPAGPVPVVTTHLASAPHLSALRCEQVRSLAGFVAEHAHGADHPPVVAGDLNAEADSDELRLLGGWKTAPAVPGLVLVDAWSYADPRDPGHTWSRRNPHVAVGGSPGARIDHVLVGLPGHPEAAGRGRVGAGRVTGDEAVDGVWPSDHAAVVVDLASSD